MRRPLSVAALLLILGAAFLFWRQSPATRTPGAGTAIAPLTAAIGASTVAATPAPLSAAELEANYPLAARLNAADSTVSRDLDVMAQIFENWRTNFPHEGNPVGENADITAALTGANRLSLVIIPKGHHALNDRGELCDRWGTPLRFHQLSGSRMEIRSAGPDRKFATDDDSLWNPP